MTAAFWHIYCVNNWYDICFEQLAVLKKSNFPFPVYAHIAGSPTDKYELETLADTVQVPLITQRHDDNLYEYYALAHLQEYCAGAEDKVLYFHTKNASNKGLTYTKWRWMMQQEIIMGWPARLQDLDTFDVVGVNYHAAKGWIAGNFWWCRSEHIRRLPPLQKSSDRFYFEKWLLSGPPATVKSLISADAEPCEYFYYPRHGNPHQRFVTTFVR